MTRKFFNIQWADLNFEKQEAIKEVLKSVKLREAKTEGEGLLKLQWHDPEPKTWQEAYVRSYGIDMIIWAGYENRNDPERPSDEQWVEMLDEHLDQLVEDQAKIHFNRSEIEVDI